MTDEELLEWYKNNNANKPADMSQKDYELNMNKALKLQTDKQLQTNLANQQAAIAKSQQAAQQSASISNEKLLKYLGQSQIANNVASGQKGTDYINANNNYMQARANIANNAAQQQTDVLENYNLSKLENENNAYNNEISILDKYRQRDIEDKQRANDEEDRQRDIQQWELEMDAYREQLRQTIDSYETSKEDKIKAQQEADDVEWLEAANEKINKMYSTLMDDDGNIDAASKNQIEQEIEKYRSKFNNDKYYQMLLDLYQTMVYGN